MRKLVHGLVGAALVVAGTGTAATAVLAAPAWCVPGGRVAAAALPARLAAGTCEADGVTIADGPASVVLPERGTGVAASVLTTTGAHVLRVARAADGSVTIERDLPAALAPEASAQAAASACSSSAFVKLGYRVGTTYRWRYNAANAPANVRAGALTALKAATSAITNGNDGCGIAGKPRVGHAFAGTTAAAPGVSASGGCGVADRTSVTGWKSLTSGALAVTCTRWAGTGNVVTESDAALNTRYAWVTGTAACSNALDLQGVVTHERGHTFGLGHAPDADLTMYPSLPYCDPKWRTLGRGDLLGLFSIYGRA